MKSPKVLHRVGHIFISVCLVEAKTHVRKDAFCIVKTGVFEKVILSPALWPPILSFCNTCQYIRIAFNEVEDEYLLKTLVSYCK